MPWTAIGAGAGTVLGGLLTNESQKRQAQRQMDFQERMSSTAHQRQVKDLEAAGLNPILSANAGASAPQGSQAQLENAAAPGMSNALQARMIKNQMNETESRISLNAASKQAQEAAAHRDNTTAKNVSAQTLALEKQMPAIIEKSRSEAATAKWRADNANFYNTTDLLNQGLGTANSATDLIKLFKTQKNQNQLNRTKDGTLYNTNTGEIFTPWKK